MPAIELQPLDTLFFRDARPMQAGAGSGGHGANWPMPTVIHEALRSALLRFSGSPAPGERAVATRKTPGVARKRSCATRAYESLRTLGPFPIRAQAIYFPAPCDLVPDSGTGLSILKPIRFVKGRSNMPFDWLKPVASRARLTKASRWNWVPRHYFEKYLDAGDELKPPEQSSLFYSEHRIGIAVDRTTGSAAEGKLFAAEHLRVADEVRLYVSATLSDRDTAFGETQITLEDCIGRCVTLGGESRMCRVLPGGENLLYGIARPAGVRIKWVLATPAIFRGGWLPNWISPGDGAVLLRAGDTERRTGEDRKTWRERVRRLPPIRAKLVAACIHKPICFSGWDLNLENEADDGSVRVGGPKPTSFAVAGGAVYFFEADGESDAGFLTDALHGRTQSDFYGEKGMGLGFCGRWEPLD